MSDIVIRGCQPIDGHTSRMALGSVALERIRANNARYMAIINDRQEEEFGLPSGRYVKETDALTLFIGEDGTFLPFVQMPAIVAGEAEAIEREETALEMGRTMVKDHSKNLKKIGRSVTEYKAWLALIVCRAVNPRPVNCSMKAMKGVRRIAHALAAAGVSA